MIGFVAVCISACDRRGNLLANRSVPGAVCFFPGQAILLPLSADDSLGILVHSVFFLCQGVLVLRLNVTAADLNGIQLVAADTPEQKFLTARLRVEIPTLTNLH